MQGQQLERCATGMFGPKVQAQAQEELAAREQSRLMALAWLDKTRASVESALLLASFPD
jgi:hypothetical protein